MARWCNHYGCWCSDAEDITEGMGDCDYICTGCIESEEVTARCDHEI